MLAVIGQESLAEGASIGAAHIDSPRLDLKPSPLYEDSELAYLKTHTADFDTLYPNGPPPVEETPQTITADGSEQG